MNERATQIEALLFALGKPLSRSDLAEMLACSAAEVEEALETLRQGSRGVVLVDDGTVLELRVAPSVTEVVEQVRKQDYSRDIGRAGLEVLAAILYRGPLSRSEIDFIRGVNSSQTVRTLLMRGLIQKTANPKSTGRGGFVYEPTTEALATLGVTHLSDLPDYQGVQNKLKELEVAYHNTAPEQTS